MTTSPSTRTWLDAARAYAATRGIPRWVEESLTVFGPDAARWEDDFEALECARPAPLDPVSVAAALADEAEDGQPAMFARRAAAVEDLLAGLPTPAARVLRVGLRARLDEICDGPRPRMRRVRALADFYYSLAARLTHAAWVEDAHRLDDLIAALVWREVKPGLEHALMDGQPGGLPVHVNLLRVDPGRVRVDVANLYEETRGGAPLTEILEGRATAAISGGFFLYSETDIEPPSRRHDPVGLLLADGVVLVPPVFRRAGLLLGDGAVEIRPVDLHDVGLHVEGVAVALATTWNRARADVGPDEPSIAIVGDRVVAVGRGLAVPLNGFVATIEGGVPTVAVAGARVSYDAPCVGAGPAHAGICGGPMLVEDGEPVFDLAGEDFRRTAPPVTFSQDETGDHNLLARMAVGLDGEGRLLAAAVDGRNMHRAVGMTLADVGRLMIQLGCERAANFDGGSSKRMVVDGRVMDLASTEIVAEATPNKRVRPLHTAILFRA